MLENLDIKKSALLVIDLQNAFSHPKGTLGISGVDVAQVEAIVGPTKALAEKFNKAGMPVFWTLQEHLAIDHRRQRKQLPDHTSKRKQVSALANSWDAAFVDEVAEIAQLDPGRIIRKHRFGSFYETRLQVMLEMHGIDALFVTGATTNACVETTIREAYLRDYDVIAIEDCIAGVRPEWEASAKQVWAQYLALLTNSADVGDWIEQQTKPRTLRFGHMLIKAVDLDETAKFYFDLLGFQIRPDAKPLPDGRPFIATHQGLAFTAGGDGSQDQMDHYAFEVTGVDALAARLKKANVEFFREIGPGPYGRTIYIKDPNNNIVELYEDVDEA
jgi:nicotinamidase-related amidase/catechol 2,3-dioxygenase-like lactoylglutathione lyase family enzyme